MVIHRQTAIPTLVRVKPGALDRMGLYLQRQEFRRIVLFVSAGFVPELLRRFLDSMRDSGIDVLEEVAVDSIEFDSALEHFQSLPKSVDALVGLGGGKALDVAKYVSFLARIPYVAVPTSLSNDGFGSPQSSLTLEGQRRSFPSIVPFGVVIDTAVCLGSPLPLWHSGVGDLVAKLTAVADWKIAFHEAGETVDDFAALLSDASVYQFIARPHRDLEGTRLLGAALLSNGVAMSICGSSRPASGSEHLISHALDELTSRPRLHGLQVGAATYLCSQLQRQNTELIRALLEETGFRETIMADPFDRAEWLEAIRRAPRIKSNFHTVLSREGAVGEAQRILWEDDWLAPFFTRP